MGVERLHSSGFRYGAQIGVTQTLRPVGQVSVGLDYLTIPKYRGGASQWYAMGEMPSVSGFYAFYLGSSLTGFENDDDVQYLNQFSYLGLTYYNLRKSGFTKPYIQIGARNDYLNRSVSLRPQVEIGVRWGWR